MALTRVDGQDQARLRLTRAPDRGIRRSVEISQILHLVVALWERLVDQLDAGDRFLVYRLGEFLGEHDERGDSPVGIGLVPEPLSGTSQASTGQLLASRLDSGVRAGPPRVQRRILLQNRNSPVRRKVRTNCQSHSETPELVR